MQHVLKNFSERFVFLISELGYKNINEFSKALNYSSSEKLSRLTRSNDFKPSFETLSDIANTFEKVNINWLISGKGNLFIGDLENTLNEPPPTYQINSLQKINIDEKEYNALLEKVKMLEQINELQKKIIDNYESGNAVATKVG